MFAEFRNVWPDQSVLDRTRDTAWIAEWKRASPGMSAPTMEARLNAIGRLMQFQYDVGESDWNILELVCTRSVDRVPIIAFPQLGFSVQREADAWANTLPVRQDYRAIQRTHVLRFAAFSGNWPNKWPTLDAIIAWIRQHAHCDRRTLRAHVGWLKAFFIHLYRKRLIAENPLGRIVRLYPRRGLQGVVDALGDPEPQRRLLALQPRAFRGPLADAMDDYLTLKRAAGRIYDYEFSILLSLDRFLASADGRSLDGALFADWIQSLDHLHSATLAHYYGQVRLFCKYLRRLDANAFVPDVDLAPAARPPRLPLVLTEDEVRLLFKVASDVSNSRRTPLRQESYCLLLTLLYCCGLRLGEALKLEMGDVDLKRGVLTIRRAKFFKNRMVPMDPSTTDAVARYVISRAKAGFPEASNQPLLCSSRRKGYSKTGASNAILALMVAARIRSNQRRVRIHDIRHTYAVHRLTKWYRSGDDVQARLPLLSQYMGHVDISYTRRYLSLVPDLCEAAMQRFHDFSGVLSAPNDEA